MNEVQFLLGSPRRTELPQNRSIEEPGLYKKTFYRQGFWHMIRTVYDGNVEPAITLMEEKSMKWG
jgi:hypothetical protein